jgi:hypothetical protein
VAVRSLPTHIGVRRRERFVIGREGIVGESAKSATAGLGTHHSHLIRTDRDTGKVPVQLFASHLPGSVMMLNRRKGADRVTGSCGTSAANPLRAGSVACKH